MANNNNLLFNAALNGYVAGALSGRSITDGTAADYAALVAQGVNLATEVDSKIANDGTISGGGGVTLPPTTAAIQDAQVSKTSLMISLVKSAFDGRFSAPATPASAASFTVIAAAIAAAYTETIASQATG